MDMPSVNFKNVKVFTIHSPIGIARRNFEGNFTQEELKNRLVEEWIPYTECSKCGKSDYCKYTQVHLGNSERKLDIKCGVAIEALSNYINLTFNVLYKASNKQKQSYLDAAYYFCDFVFKAEEKIGFFISPSKIKWWGDKMSLMDFLHVVSLRDTLNCLANNLKNFPEFNLFSSVVFVEGESEKIFLEKLSQSGNGSFYFIIESYGGYTNRKPNKIHLLIDDYKRKGYNIFIQGDCDGKKGDTFQQLIKKVDISAENTFQFEYDFETSIPSETLFIALDELKIIGDVEKEIFLSKTRIRNKKISIILKEQFGIDIESKKTKIAEKVAEILTRPYGFHNISSDNSELVRFVHFIKDINS